MRTQNSKRFAPGRQMNTAMLRGQVMAKQTNSARRLQKDYKELKDAEVPLVGVSAAPLDDDFFTWHANLRGPEGTAFFGGVFHCEITFPANYPVSPPSIKLFTTVPHPNVFGTELCLDILRSNSGSWYEGWNSAYTVETILIQLQSFLFEVPASVSTGFVQTVTHEDEIDLSALNSGSHTLNRRDARNKYKKAVDEANAYKCDKCKHKGPIEPYPAFNTKESDLESFVMLKDAKTLLAEEFVCYHTRARVPEVALGVGVSLSRLPRTGEIRSVQPTEDLLSMRAFTKHKIRKSISNERFSYWLPLYFGENAKFEVKEQYFDEEKKQYETRTHLVDPRERIIHLLKHAICFMTKGSTQKDFESSMVLEIMPKLIITHMVEMANEKKHMSIAAIRRLINYIRLFRLLIELCPQVMGVINEKINTFITKPETRVKDHTASLGDILAMVAVSDRYSMKDLLDGYLEEQLDRQAFWIIRQIPELDHTDEKFKNKEVILEDSRAEVCFKTGIAGFQITMLFYSLSSLFESAFDKNWKKFEDSIDNNYGCLAMNLENDLQKTFKQIQRVESFQMYYKMIGVDCPDAQALATRLRQAIQNSKDKKYHGSSEHMNELPEMKVQARDQLMQEPSPFATYNESTKSFTDKNDPFWAEACQKKFSWVHNILNYSVERVTPAMIASVSDRQKRGEKPSSNALADTHLDLQQKGFNFSEMMAEMSYSDYKSDFSWRQLFHKLCFEQMLANFSKICDFQFFYEYMNKIGAEIDVLAVPIINKTPLKSNHYWVMVLLSKMPNLRVVKFQGLPSRCSVTPDFFKFLVKGMNYMKQQGKSLEKLEFHKALGYPSADNLYQVLKPNTELLVLDVSGNPITQVDAKAIGKILADFKNIQELNVSDANLTAPQTKEIADGLMRAKKLEILKINNNRGMTSSVQQIIYNLAFSPKIRVIDMSDTSSGSDVVAEALYKLIKISGAIEVLNLANSGVAQFFKLDFYKALGENKTLQYLNINSTETLGSKLTHLGTAIAMNAYKNGSLTAVSAVNCFAAAYLLSFIEALKISEQLHEQWYGDARVAEKMEKEQLVKHMHCNLKFFNIRSSKLKFLYNYKELAKQKKPVYPSILEFVTKMDSLDLNLKRCTLEKRDMETLAFMLADNPYSAKSSIRSLSLSLNNISKEGSKLFAPSIGKNDSLQYLNLSSCKLGVSGMVQISKALESNKSIKSLNLYRNIFDVDGARALGNALKKNSTLEMIDIGHNRIRITGLSSIVQGILANATSKVSALCIKSNFISDEGFTQLFDQLVLPKTGRPQRLTKLWLKSNFMSEYHKRHLHQRCQEAGLIGQIYIDDFEVVPKLDKSVVDRSIWVAPVPTGYAADSMYMDVFFSEQNECGLIVDVRLRTGRLIPGRTRPNCYAIVEYAHENSVPRSLKLASKKKANLAGQSVRIYKAGTKTAVPMPTQRRR